MTNEQNALSKEEAKESLENIESAKLEFVSDFKAPMLLRVFSSLSFAAIIFGYGMTTHDNMWALAMWVGGFGFTISIALYIYTYRIIGIKPTIIPKSSASIKLNIITAIIFSILVFSSRQLRIEGYTYAPHISAAVCAIIFYVLQYKYPTGEVVESDKHA